MNKVLSGLYLGNYRDSKDMAQLQRHRITHILAIHDAPRRLYPDKEYLCIMASDSPYQNLSQYFSACNDFIHAGRTSIGGNVLIHCLAGMSRSVTIAIAYLMSIASFSMVEAEKIVRGARPVSNPNAGFMKQLQDFEGCSRLFEERRRILDKYPLSTILESDMDLCNKHLASYNHLITHQHPIKSSPRKVPPASSPAASSKRYESTESISEPESPRPPLKKCTSLPNSPASPSTSTTTSSRSPRPRPSRSIRTPPETPPQWERHYGCWKEHFQAKNNPGSSPARTSSTPASPVHYKVNRANSRADSVSSLTSVTSLPAHLTPGGDPVMVNYRQESRPYYEESPDPRRRRRLPQPRYPTPSSSRDLTVGEEEDETLAVVLVDEITPAAVTQRSIPVRQLPATPASSSAVSRTTPRGRGQQVDKSRSLTARASLGITRWVMKRSGAFRYAMENS